MIINHFHGLNGVPKDRERNIYWLRKAAKQILRGRATVDSFASSGNAGTTGKSILIFRNRVKPRNQKYSASAATQITAITPAIHPGKRGVSRSSRTRGWMRWTQRRRARSWSQGGFSRERSNVAQTTGVSRPSPLTSHRHLAGRSGGEGAAYGEVAWFWHPWLMSSRRRCVGPTGLKTNLNPLATVTTRIRRREERVISRKAIAQGK
jgi:hypothetical protein